MRFAELGIVGTLYAKPAPTVLQFDLRNVFDVDFDKKSFVEPRWIPGKSGLPAVQIAIERQTLGRNAGVGDDVDVDGIVKAQFAGRIEAKIGFDPRAFGKGANRIGSKKA